MVASEGEAVNMPVYAPNDARLLKIVLCMI